ncbi:MAG TPA: hypothetical protein VHW09_05615 [Bryobacteraceae bacterium]|jgi:DUF4097 and DUF4098 domain-containing protein YvlB|nr:hypothetical protein [Bryobacteraceae bacterium]
MMRVSPALALGGLSVALLCLTSCVVDVGDWQHYSKDFHSSYPLKSGGRLTVETFNGAVDISPWDQDTIDISGTKFGPSQEDADNLRVDVDHSSSSVSIHVQRPTDRHNNEGARLTIKVPHGTELERIVTSNSSIRVEDCVGPSRLKSSNGAIHVVNLKGDLEAETSNNAIELDNVDGNVRAHSSNGHIRAGRINGSIEVGTSNSGVDIDVMRSDKDVRVDTSNNGVELTLPPNFSSGVHVETRNGPITLRLGDGANALVSARTSNSSIDTDFEVRARGELSKNRLEGAIGNGGPLMELITSNASIRLVKR